MEENIEKKIEETNNLNLNENEIVNEKTKASSIIIIISIVISILIIISSMYYIVTTLLGVTIFNSGKKAVEDSKYRISETERLTYNRQFTEYEGENKKGTDIRNLVYGLILNYERQVTDGEFYRLP